LISEHYTCIIRTDKRTSFICPGNVILSQVKWFTRYMQGLSQMIAFDLKCKNEHVFEGWFKNDGEFKKQKKKGLLVCPVCSDKNVVKILSSFAMIKSSGNPAGSTGMGDVQVEKDFIRKAYEFIENNFDNVGSDFTKEALKIHYGVSEPRNIRGVSTDKEEKMLKEEGVDILKIPVPAHKTDTDA